MYYDLISSDPLIAALLFSILGACFGSFLSLLIPRLNFGEGGIIAGRSKCPKCQNTLKWNHLIPILSWLFQKGKCDHCAKPIPKTYPLIELTSAITLGSLGSFFFGQMELPQFLSLWALCHVLLFLFFFDVLYKKIDIIGIQIGLIIALSWVCFSPDLSFQEAIYGGIIGFFFYWIQFAWSKGRWVGEGDMYMGLFMGVCLGSYQILGALFFAYIIGLFVLIPGLLTGTLSRKSEVPMGAFLMPSFYFFLCGVGALLFDWYLNLFNIPQEYFEFLF